MKVGDRGTEPERFWAKVDKTDGCWFWTASVMGRGYGQFWSAARLRNVPAHRWAYEALVGAIPEGLELDHLCRNPRCVNPDHLEPVTQRENLARGISPTAHNGRKTHCVAGHALNGDNLYIDPRGRRQCRACRSASASRFRERHPGYYDGWQRKQEAAMKVLQASASPSATEAQGG